MPLTLSVLPVPTFLSTKLAVVYVSANVSPLTPSSDRVTVAPVVPS